MVSALHLYFVALRNGLSFLALLKLLFFTTVSHSFLEEQEFKAKCVDKRTVKMTFVQSLCCVSQRVERPSVGRSVLALEAKSVVLSAAHLTLRNVFV